MDSLHFPHENCCFLLPPLGYRHVILIYVRKDFRNVVLAVNLEMGLSWLIQEVSAPFKTSLFPYCMFLIRP